MNSMWNYMIVGYEMVPTLCICAADETFCSNWIGLGSGPLNRLPHRQQSKHTHNKLKLISVHHGPQFGVELIFVFFFFSFWRF